MIRDRIIRFPFLDDAPASPLVPGLRVQKLPQLTSFSLICPQTLAKFFVPNFWRSSFSSRLRRRSLGRLIWAYSWATRIAFFMALGVERPWLMITTPSTPRRGAPPYSE